MLEEGRSGWIKKLTDLRNDIFHVAPIGANHIFPSCYERKVAVTGGGELRSLSYGLLQRSPELQERIQLAIAARDQQAIKDDLKQYKNELERSDDALTYAWNTLANLCSLAEQARVASGLKGKVLHLTDEDIIEVRPG